MEYRYSLRSGSKKDFCPNCQKKTFKPYVDKKTNQEAGSKYGRCERINSCGYSLYPKSDEEWKPEIKPYQAPKPTEYIVNEIVESTFNEYRSNIFFRYLRETFGADIATDLVSKYNIGTAKYGGTIFWQQDLDHRFRTGKIMYYHSNGRRNKEKNSWFAHSKISPDFEYKQCFFGLHLATKDYPLALCESEKTAVLMSVYQPEYTWLASGGSEMLNITRLNELPRLDKVFADGGQFEKWEMKTKHFQNRQMDLSVENAIAEKLLSDGSDILDLIQLNL